MSVEKLCKIKFAETGTEVSVEADTSILDAARAAGVMHIDCCGLTPPCGRCRIAVLEGEENVSQVTALEAQTSEIYGYLPYERVGCLTRISGDVLVEVRE